MTGHDPENQQSTPDEQQNPDDQQQPKPKAVDPESKARKQAAAYRRRLREAEAERDSLTTRLQAQQQAVIDAAAEDAHLAPELVAAAGITAETVTADDGTIDLPQLAKQLEAAATKYRISRSPKPNRQQGNPSAAPVGDWGSVLANRRR